MTKKFTNSRSKLSQRQIIWCYPINAHLIDIDASTIVTSNDFAKPEASKKTTISKSQAATKPVAITSKAKPKVKKETKLTDSYELQDRSLNDSIVIYDEPGKKLSERLAMTTHNQTKRWST